MLSACPTCGTDIEDASLSCPGCGWLTRSPQLQSLANEAQAAARTGNLPATRDLWLQAAALLPQDTVQYRSIQARVTDLDSQIAASHAPPTGIGRKIISALAPAGLLLWKFKALLLGLTKIGTLLSMIAFFGVYWSLYGWPLALGIVLSIYIHEMGHVLELRSYGIPASAPMFIPGLGAFVRLKTASITPVQDSRIGLAGPIYGLGAALAALAVYLLTGWKVWAAIANFTAVINLFNLIPVWQLDGSRGIRSFTQQQRIGVLIMAFVLWFIVHQPMLLLIVFGGVYRLFTRDAAAEPDQPGLMRFATLLAGFAAVTVLAPIR